MEPVLDNIFELCRLPENGVKNYAAIEQVPLFDIEQCLAFDDVADWFLHWVFFHYRKLTDELRIAILNHAHCPDTVLLASLAYKPEWTENCVALGIRKLREVEAGNSSGNWANVYENFVSATFQRQLYVLYSYVGTLDQFRACPLFIIEGALARANTKTLRDIADHGVPEHQQYLVGHKNFRARLALAKVSDILEEHALILVGDETVSVRQAMAERTDLSERAVAVLLEDNDEKVRQTLNNNKQLPDEIVQRLFRDKMHESLGEATKLDAVSSTKAALSLLGDDDLPKDVLLKLAAHESAVVRCAAVREQNADEDVFALPMQRLLKSSASGTAAKLPAECWMVSPIAGRTTNQTWISLLAGAKDPDVLFELVHNKAVPRTTVLEILKRQSSAWFRAAVAAEHWDDESIMNEILGGDKTVTGWVKRLAAAMDPATKTGELLKLHRDFDYRHVCISRAIARHSNCPKSLHKLYGHYLPGDLKRNPAFAEATSKLPAVSMQNWKVTQQLKDCVAHGFIANHYGRQYLEDLRAAVDCRFADDRILLDLVFCDDATAEKRLLKRSFRKLPRFIYEALLYSPRAPTRKLLAENKNTPLSVLQQLAQDNERSVARVAREVLEREGKAVPETANARSTSNIGKNLNTDKPAPLTLKSLGRKAERLELANNSLDAQVLVLLCTDKLADVRYACAGRECLSFDQLLALYNDSDERVSDAALSSMNHLNLDDAQCKHYQSLLRDIADSNASGESQLVFAARQLDDPDALVALYQRCTSRHVREPIIKRIDWPELLDEHIFELIRRQARQCDIEYLLHNPNLSAEQVIGLLDALKIKYIRVIGEVRSTQALLAIAAKCEPVKLTYYTHASKADLSFEELESLIAIDERYLQMIGDQLYKLGVQRCTSLFNRGNKVRKWLISSRNLPNEIVTMLRDWVLEQDNDSMIAEFFKWQSAPASMIEQFIDYKNKDVRSHLVEYQKLSTDQLLRLARDKSLDVRWNVMGRTWARDHEPMPDNVLIVLAGDREKDISRDALEELGKRGISIEDLDSRAA